MLAEHPRCDRAADIGDADQRNGKRTERGGGGDAEPREHPAGVDRAADLGDEGGEMRGDEAELIAAGEEAEKDEDEARVPHRGAHNRTHASLSRDMGNDLGRAQDRKQEQGRKDRRSKDQEDRGPGHDAEERLGGERTHDLAA